MSGDLTTSRTAILEFALHMADSITRKPVMTASIGREISPLATSGALKGCVSSTRSITVGAVDTFICIYSASPLLLDLSYTATSGPADVLTDVPCKGVFVLFGSLDSVVIKSDSSSPVAVSYAYG